MNINVTLVVQMIAFAIFVYGTMKLIVPPLMKMMADRQSRIAEGLAAAEKGARSLQDAAVKTEEQLKAARAQAQDILGGANRQAAKIVEDAKGQAQVEADRIKQSGRAEIEREIAAAKEQLRKQLGDLAVLGAARILKREIDAKAHADVIKELAARI
jgi:F-type H+-transporting ATPase subunit b